MSDKYYTPSIEEFHIGFEYEEYNSYRKEWNNRIWTLDNFENSGDVYQLFERYYGEELRIKYLDSEDIESLGFVKDSTYSYKKYYRLDPIYIEINPEYIVKDTIEVYNNSELLFKGFIKNKSELKKLLVQLGIL